MRKFIFIVFTLVFINFQVEAQTESQNLCHSFLIGNRSTLNTTINKTTENLNHLDELDTSHENHRDHSYPLILVDTLSKVRQIIDKAKNLKFISKSKYDHLLEDLEELSKNLDKKSKNESFMEIVKKWYEFSLILEKQIQSFENLNPTLQRLYFEKMKLPVAFMTSHFITFLETKHLKFSYQRLYSLLKSNVDSDSNSDLVLFLYQFEKQVLKFFSRNEFVDCQA